MIKNYKINKPQGNYLLSNEYKLWKKVIMKLKQLSEEEMISKTGGAIASFLIGGALLGLAIPVIKNLFNAQQADIGLPGGFKVGWNNRDVTNIKNLEAKLEKLQNLYNKILPPFYEI